MCRIAGIIDNNRTHQEIKSDVKLMCNAMAHGGPDDEGLTLVNEHAVFGHRRLSIIDLTTAGHQPMTTEQFTISYNGEIYNYQTLKSQLLDLNFHFNTETDTEVILVGFKAWGPSLFTKLEGMFAFAIYDHQRQETFLVRDQMGIKPLYYSAEKDQLIFSSEVKAFSKTAYSFPENEDWKVYFLAFGHIPHPFTTLKNVYALPGGTYLKWNHSDQTHQTNSFISGKTEKTITHPEEANASIEKELAHAVQKHLISDAPIGVFLSGGIDSSILTLLANEKVGNRLNTLSINFVEEAFSEEKYQKIISDRIDGKHSSYRVTEKDFNDNFENIMTAMDQPTNDGINSWFVNKCAKENGLKAVLSGIGADELLGGYPSFKRMALIKSLKKLPKSILKLSIHLPSDKLNRIYFLSYQNPVGEYLFLRGFFTPNMISKILDQPQKKIDQLFEDFPFSENIDELEGEERAAWFETNLFMKNQLLKDTDFMSMSHGIEVRVPFLDQCFVDTTKKISKENRFQIRPKGLLINAFKNILPETIWNRPKMGFTFPLQQWFLSSGLITNERLYQNNNYNQKLITKFKRGEMHWSKAFALYQVSVSTKI
ncbi:MAG: asparagine synthase (glutamine-hydrolyzing) [Pedobacter sp.]|nr:MAG: asparagine synthase (glutamine-hydrolyzing) [Pedobacter sp.]